MMKIAPAVLLVLALTTNTVNAQDCTATADCDETSFCSAGVCSPKGSCGSDTDCMNPDNLYAVAACVGVVSCLEGQCGITCGPSFCPEGVEEVECETDPCLDFKFGCFAAESCASSSCGECSAVLFDQAGNVLVPEEDCNVPAEAGCASNADCGEGAFCASGKCLATGLCDSGTDCTNPSNIFAMVDCVGVMSCQEGACSMECGPSFCEEGVEEVECEGDPCLDFQFGCFAAESCAVNTCGECSAILYGQDGSVLVPEQDCNVPAEVAPKCGSNADCAGAMADNTDGYCAAGECLEMASCSVTNDCKNPNNVFAMIECVGVLSCDDGRCGIECGPSFCEEGVEQVNCVADPCLDFKFGCPAAESCVANTCGDCSPILFDQAGNDMGADCEMPVATDFIDTEDTCMSDSDCDEDGYCADGGCLAKGQCNERIDCFNPVNLWPMAMCVGMIDCMEGPNATQVCGVECGPKECPGGEDRTPCPEPTTCDVANCEGAVSCHFDGCGGDCTEIFFDAAGTQICVDEPVQLPASVCSSDADCNPTAEARAFGEGYFCAQGECMEKGKCFSDVDCLNPANERPIPACVGYAFCDEQGMCAFECGSQCPDGADFSLCEPAPCENENNTCATSVACVNDNCNGCNAIFLDAAGNEVKDSDCDVPTATFNNGNSSAVSAFCLSSMLAMTAMPLVAQILV